MDTLEQINAETRDAVNRAAQTYYRIYTIGVKD